ncbi:MAG: tetratricopeptide repeat protein [bacterium]|nr:tetratricopeptide repeat protein [bacterium]
MVATATILLVCLATEAVLAKDSPSDGWVEARVDSIASLLADRRTEDAVGLSRTLVASLESQGAQGADLALGLETLARSLRRNREFGKPETLEIANRAITVCSESPVADPDLKASCLNTLGLILYQRSEYEEALPMFEAAAEFWVEARGPDDQKLASALNNQGLVLEALGRNDGARFALEKAAGIYETRQNDPIYLIKFAQTTMSIAKLHIKLGQYDQARLKGEQAVEIYRSAPGGSHYKLGSAMGDLAALYRTMGDLDRSEKLYETALPLVEVANGLNHSEVGRILNNLGNLHADRGDIAAARSCFERALVITEKTRGSDDPQTGVRLLNLGSILADLGDFDQAAIYLKRSEEIFLERLSPNHLYVGYNKQDLGTVLAAQGEFEEGLSELLQAQGILETQLGQSHLSVAAILGDVGNVLMDLHRYSEAGQALKRGVAIVRDVLGPEHPEVARLLHSQGRLALKNRDAQGAEIVLTEALVIGTKALGPDHPDLAAIHLDLSHALTDQDQLPAAFDHALLAERIGRYHFTLAAAAFEERRVLQFAQQRTRGLGLATTLALRMDKSLAPEITTSLWEELIRSRGMVLDLMGSRQRYQQHSSSSGALVDDLEHATSELANLFVRGVGEDSPEDYKAALDAARKKHENLELKLAATSLDFARQMATSKAGYFEVASSLPQGAVLVSYLTYSSSSEVEPSLAALVLRPDDPQPEIHDLGPAVTVEKAVDSWRETVVAGLMADGDQLQVVTEDYLQAGRSLAALIWDPLQLDQVQSKVCIVPDGAISFVDFMPLPRLEGGFLVENEAILTLVSSERDLLPQNHPLESGSGLMVMGGMKFGSRDRSPDSSDCDGYQDLFFNSLPGTNQEAQTVAGLWSEYDDGPVHKYVGDEAAEGAFKTSVASFEVVHLATHGFFLGNECRDPANITRGVGVPFSSGHHLAFDDLVNPLLRSGLAFSGANIKSNQNHAEDGILTAFEVAGLDLSSVEVAILSACDTGQGEWLEGEGVFGLQRAFAMAGTRSLIMSLWPVDDGVAATWMEHLYRNHLQGGMDFSLAARQASRKMLFEQRAKGWPEHPFTWAPFVRVRTGS